MPDYQFAATCPHCGKVNDRVLNPFDDATPSDGDYSLCIGCGEWGIFATIANGGLRKPTFEELEQTIKDPKLLRARKAWLLGTAQAAARH